MVRSRSEASPASGNLLSMAKSRPTQIGSDTSHEGAMRVPGTIGGAAALRPATRSLRDVLTERGPLTGPVTDAGTRALLAVRGERSDGEHGH